MKKLIVTGASGFIGSNFVKKCEELGGYDIVPVDVVTGTNYMDLSETDFVGVDALVHLANYKFNNSYSKSVKDMFATSHLIDVCPDNVKFIFASSAAVHGDVLKNGIYAYAKHEQEKRILDSNINNVSILRFFNVYGPGANSGIIYEFLKLLKSDEPLIVNGDGFQSRDFIHVDDVVVRLLQEVESLDTGIIIDDVGTGKSTTINELIQIMSDILGRKLETNYVNLPQGPFTSKAERGHFSIDLKEGLKGLIEYARI